LIPEVAIAVVTAVIGLLAAGILTLINNSINVRAGVDVELRKLRLENYPDLWRATGVTSRWPRTPVDRTTLADLHQTLRCWYYEKGGGIYLSEQARARYGDVQKLIAALLSATDADKNEVLSDDSYADLMETTSALRTGLTQDLDTRRRRSMWDNRRRARWHARAADKMADRMARAKPTDDPKIWQTNTGGEKN